jgi:hypothetical protein
MADQRSRQVIEGLHLSMNFLLSNRLFDRYLCRSMADQRSRQVIALTLKSSLMPCAAIAIAITEKGIFPQSIHLP